MRKQLTFLLAAGTMLVLPGLVMGQSNFTGGGDGSTWNDAANWDNGLPAGANGSVGDGFIVDLSTDQAVNDLDVVGDQNDGTATLNHSAGILTVAGWTKIGGNGISGAPDLTTGTYNLTGTASAVGAPVTHIGFRGGTGTLSVSGNANYGQLGETGVNENEFNIAGGNAFQDGTAGNDSIGTLNVSDSATVQAGRFNLGNPGSTATVNQTGGTVTSNTWVALANFGTGGTATYNISAGSVSANNGNFAIGQEGIGTVNVSGTAVVSQAATGAASLAVGGLIEGSFTQDGTGTLSITGSSASISSANFQVAATAASTGTVSWTADSGGVTPIVCSGDTLLGAGNSSLVLDLSADPASATAGTEYLLVDNAAAVVGTFSGLVENATVSIGGGNDGTLSYAGGTDGFDIVVTAVGGTGLTGDFNGDTVVDCDDVDFYSGNIGADATGELAQLNLDGDTTVTVDDAIEHITTLVGTLRGDLDCDGDVDVLQDAFILVGSLGTTSGAAYTDGDIDFDGDVDVLGDAFILVGNLGMSNQ